MKISKLFNNNLLKNIKLKNPATSFNFCTNNKTIDYKKAEQEWTEMYITKMKQNKDYLEKQLSDIQKKEVELIVEAIANLTQDERKYYNIIFKHKIIAMTGLHPARESYSNPSTLLKSENLWPKENPNWYKSPHLQSTVAAFTGGAAAQAQQGIFV
jgi:hypothetical protein